MKKIEMDKLNIDERKTSFKQFKFNYTKAQAIAEASRCLNCKNPSCVKGCPISNNIPQFIQKIKEDDILGAYKILLDRTVLPEICGNVCAHEKQCQGSCVKGIKGDPISIGALERYVAENIRKNNLDDLSYISNKKSVAIVGSGPAGLASAFYLAKAGFEVTVYEKENYLGGVINWGIPSFRLDKTNIINSYYQQLQKLNVKFVMNCNVGKDVSIEELKSNNDFVIIGIGALLPNKMNIIGEDLPYVIQAKDFLSDLSNMNEEQLDKCDKYGKNILVIGGGNVAFDSARSAIRLKDVENVSIVYRRSEKEMPVSIEELDDAKTEGVNFLTLTTPVKFNDDHKVECALMELGEPDSSGRRKPIESNKEHIYIEADSVIMAIGFKNSPINCDGLQNNELGRIVVDENYETSIKNVYAIGDSVSGSATVVNAMKQALVACQNIINKI